MRRCNIRICTCVFVHAYMCYITVHMYMCMYLPVLHDKSCTCEDFTGLHLEVGGEGGGKEAFFSLEVLSSPLEILITFVYL